jgi:hypothetical protein
VILYFRGGCNYVYSITKSFVVIVTIQYHKESEWYGNKYSVYLASGQMLLCTTRSNHFRCGGGGGGGGSLNYF